jgi:predicted nucleic acid-binding protein
VSVFVDANVFIRLLTGDDPEKAARSLALFKRAQRGELTLVTSESVIAEIAYVLSSRTTYRIARATIAAALGPLVADPSLQIDHKEAILRSLELWKESTLDFTDCLSAEHVRRANLDGIYSYDRDFDRVPDIHRLEP